MSGGRAVLLTFAMGWLMSTPASSQENDGTLREQIVTGVSQADVAITADFSGEEILIYGAIERSRFLAKDEPSPDVILIVEGPEKATLVRKKERVAGIWINRHYSLLSAAPSFYAISSTAPLEEIVTEQNIEIYDIGFEQAILKPGTSTDDIDPEIYREAAIQLNMEAGLYASLPGSVRVIGNSLFESRIRLPSNIIEGDYHVRVLLARDGDITDTHSLIIPVRRAGIGRWIYRLAQDQPLIYGLLSILIAIFAGLIASETFRRLHI